MASYSPTQWKNAQSRGTDPYKNRNSSNINKLSRALSREYDSITKGLEVSYSGNAVTITSGICIKDDVCLTFNTDMIIHIDDFEDYGAHTTQLVPGNYIVAMEYNYEKTYPTPYGKFVFLQYATQLTDLFMVLKILTVDSNLDIVAMHDVHPSISSIHRQWVDSLLPIGGLKGQVPVKNSDLRGDIIWSDGGDGREYIESLTVNPDNILTDLTHYPSSTNLVKLYVAGILQRNKEWDPINGKYEVSGQHITWDDVVGGTLSSGSDVIAIYYKQNYVAPPTPDRVYVEMLSVTGPNAIGSMTYTPITEENTKLYINGLLQTNKNLSVMGTYDIIGNDITYYEAAAGFDIDVTDKVYVEYRPSSDINDLIIEHKTIITDNTIPQLNFTPIEQAKVKLFVNGVQQLNRLKDNTKGTFSISGDTITWHYLTAGFDITSNDDIVIEYYKSNVSGDATGLVIDYVPYNAMALTQTPVNTKEVKLYLNGILQVNEELDSLGDFVVSGGNIIWNAVNSGIVLESTDIILIEYYK